MKNTLVAYCAGFFDGEGSIGISKHKSKSCRRGYTLELTIQITNTDKRVLLLFKRHFGGWLMSFKSQTGRVIWRYVIKASKCQAFLQKILPCLHIKRRQALLAIDFQKAKRRCSMKSDAEYLQEIRIRNKISALNLKGRRPAIL